MLGPVLEDVAHSLVRVTAIAERLANLNEEEVRHHAEHKDHEEHGRHHEVDDRSNDEARHSGNRSDEAKQRFFGELAAC